jgi:hypothetical protein
MSPTAWKTIRTTHTNAQKYPVEIGPGAMIYIPSFRKFGSSIQEMIRADSQTHSMMIS